MKYLIIPVIFVLFLGCTEKSQKDAPTTKRTHPSHTYRYSDKKAVDLSYLEKLYVPVYSEIYHQDGTRRFLLTVTISIRNTSTLDTAYILSAKYYDSYGKELKQYIDSTIVLSPLESIEYVVEESEELGGVGANFIVDWGANRYSDQILVQSVMIGTFGQQGISMISESKVVEKNLCGETQ